MRTEGNLLKIPSFRALINGDMVWVKGTNNDQSPTSDDNILSLPSPPATGYAINVVYLEAWYQLLDEDTTNPASGFYRKQVNGSWTRWFYPYGNALAHPNWIERTDLVATDPLKGQYLDDLQDPTYAAALVAASTGTDRTSLAYTSGRVQLQYALRVQQFSGLQLTQEQARDFGLTLVTGASLRDPQVLNVHGVNPTYTPCEISPGLYIADFTANNLVRTTDSLTYAIPIAMIFQRSTAVWTPTAPHGTASTIPGDATSAAMRSGRPDGRFPDILYPEDIIDTRSSYLGGSLEDYESVLKQATTRLWQGSLRLKVATAPSDAATAGQLGATLLSQEFIGPATDMVKSPVRNISTTTEPKASYTADATADQITYRLIPAMKEDRTDGIATDTTVWQHADRVLVQHPNKVYQFESVVIYGIHYLLGTAIRIPTTQIAVSGLGSNTVQLDFLDTDTNYHYDPAQPLWAVCMLKHAASSECFEFVPVKNYTPMIWDPVLPSFLAAGVVSDFEQEANVFTIPGQVASFKSYKRNFTPQRFGTVKCLQVRTRDLTQFGSTAPNSLLTAPTVTDFSASTQPAAQAATVTLHWSVTNADKVTISPGIGEVGLEGTMQVRVSDKTDYYLTAVNQHSSVTQPLTVEPPIDLIPGQSIAGDTITQIYQAPGGALNAENTVGSYATVKINSTAVGFGDSTKHTLAGCLKATYYRWNTATNSWDSTAVRIRHQYLWQNPTVTSIDTYEIGLFGEFSNSALDYIELEILITNEKTFHINETVKGVTAITETAALSKNATLKFSDPTAGDTRTYLFKTTLDYAKSDLHATVSVPADFWDDQTAYGGVFEGFFGYNGQAYVFVKMRDDSFYRATPCSVTGIGTPVLNLVLPQVSVSLVEDVLVLAQSTVILPPTSTVLLSYDYVPYQGEGDPTDSYYLKYLNTAAQVTTFGTGKRSVPGLQEVTSLNPRFPLAAALPSNTGWSDADLKCSKFQINGAFSAAGTPAASTAEVLQTIPLSTVTGNLKYLLEASAEEHPALSPRVQGQRGFTKNTVAFAFVVEPPVLTDSPHQQSDVTMSDLQFWVDQQVGDDTNSGLTRETAKKNIQPLVDSLPALIRHRVIINVNTVLTNDDVTGQEVPVTPYGSPDKDKVYSLITTSFKTEGQGQVIIQKDPNLSATAQVLTPATSAFTDAPFYGWVHTSGNLLLKGFTFVGTSDVMLAVYPGAQLSLDSCSIEGGSTQLLAYGARVTLAGTSLLNPSQHHVVVTGDAVVSLKQANTFSKGAATGYTFIVEKNSTLEFCKSLVTAGYADPLLNKTECWVSRYSTVDSTQVAGFSFPGAVKLSLMSSLTYKAPTLGWSMVDKDASSLTLGQ
jgi:hypothetical protein